MGSKTSSLCGGCWEGVCDIARVRRDVGERCGDGPIPAPVEVSWEAGWQKEWVESSLNTTEERAEMAIALQRVAFEESGGMCYVKYPRHRCVTLRIE